MANDFYVHSGFTVERGTTARADDINNIGLAIEAGLDKLPSEATTKRGLTDYGTDSGSANFYEVAMPYPDTAYVDGYEVTFKASATNTGASTLNVDSLGAKSIIRADGSALSAQDIVANKMTTVRYNATSDSFEIQRLVAGDMATITTVAGIADEVVTVAGIAANVVAVDANATNVNAVAAIDGEVTTVAGIAANVVAVDANATNVNVLAAIDSAVTTVAGISADVTTVSGVSANVTTVAGISSDVTTVATNNANVTAVVGISGDVTTVAGIAANVTTVAGISPNVTTVAGVSGNVTTVAGISANVTTVASLNADVTTVATNNADITTCADNIAAILDAPTQAANAAASAAVFDYSAVAITGGTIDVESMTINPLSDSPFNGVGTVVDSQVYDTSRDPDGGQWRNRCSHTSWYQEIVNPDAVYHGALAAAPSSPSEGDVYYNTGNSTWYKYIADNTAYVGEHYGDTNGWNATTRGIRAEFPAVAAVIAEATKVWIFDVTGSEPVLWMKVHSANGAAWHWFIENVAYPVISVGMRSGMLVFGIAGANNANSGLRGINFILDNLHGYSVILGGVLFNPVCDRNGGLNMPATTESLIVNSVVNDVAICTLPNAAINPDTGLPYNTIAVATDGGVSVIREEQGDVVDITTTNALYDRVVDVAFRDDGKLLHLWSFESNFAAARYLVVTAIPSSDYSIGDAQTNSSEKDEYYADSIASADLVVIIDRTAPYGILSNHGKAIGQSHGVCLLNANPTTPANGMVAYLTSTYNTGYMYGDIKGAFLCDADGTSESVVGSGELVANGTFDTDISGWIPTPDNDTVWSAGKAVCTSPTGNNDFYQAVDTIAGAEYTLEFEISNLTGASNLFIVSNSSFVNIKVVYIVTGITSITFTASTSTTNIIFRTLQGNSFEIDNISVKLATPDRSVNNNGLQVNGTLTKEPVATGAELQAWSGFSAANYLEQPYNSDLDFGTGDFYVMGWVKRTAANSFRTILMRGYYTGGAYSGSQIAFGTNGSDALRFTASDDGFATVDEMVGGVLPLNTWAHVCCIRSGSSFYLYQDGVISYSQAVTAASGSLSNSSASLVVGNSATYASAFLGSLALWRIGSGAPTAAQIREIYLAEKPLFQSGSSCTLYGTSNAVTSMDYNNQKGLLTVMTADGLSRFSGLKRVSEDATASGVVSSEAEWEIVG